MWPYCAATRQQPRDTREQIAKKGLCRCSQPASYQLTSIQQGPFFFMFLQIQKKLVVVVSAMMLQSMQLPRCAWRGARTGQFASLLLSAFAALLLSACFFQLACFFSACLSQLASLSMSRCIFRDNTDLLARLQEIGSHSSG